MHIHICEPTNTLTRVYRFSHLFFMATKGHWVVKIVDDSLSPQIVDTIKQLVFNRIRTGAFSKVLE